MSARSSRRRRNREHGNRDRWLITYADLITLLLIFFVMMLSMSRLDTTKYGDVTQALQNTFHTGNSILETGTGLAGTADGIPPATDSKRDKSANTLSPRELAFRKQEQELQNLMGVIQKYVEDHHLQDQIFVTDKPRGISITLSDRFLFDSGQAALKLGSAPTLTKLSSLFRGLGTPVSIEGHTDHTPVGSSSIYHDNWELSGARALSVLRFFTEREQLDPTHFQYAGYADTRPTGDNSTAAGRQKNRRVEITVLRQLQQ